MPLPCAVCRATDRGGTVRKSLAATQVKGRIGPTAVSPFGDQSEYPVVNAIVSGGRVTALAGWIGAAGE
jgi:hypothetical protein